MKEDLLSRRLLVKSSVLGMLAAAVPNVVFAKHIHAGTDLSPETMPHDRHPAIQLDVASEVVGVSHINLDRLKQLVDARPELAKAEWDWAFGDWESAIGAATHVGRKDIITYLVSKGATPTLFTYAVLGEYETVKMMIDSFPGIQKNLGPHGISLLQHARTGSQIDGADKSRSQKLIDYLQSFGDADGRQYLPMEETDKAKYVGDYKYGEGKNDGFSIKMNMRKIISLGKLGKSGGAILRLGENEFTYQGAPSVRVSFKIENGKVLAMTLNEPGLVLTAAKIN